MPMEVTVKKRDVRQFIREAMDGGAGEGQNWPRSIPELPSEEPPVDVNQTSSHEDSAPPLDPPVDDAEFMPANPVELAAAVDKLARRIDVETIDEFYHQYKRLVDAALEGKLGEKTEDTAEPPKDVGGEKPRPEKNDSDDDEDSDDKQKKESLERIARAKIRKMLMSEAAPQFDYSYSGDVYADAETDDDETGEKKKNLTVTDVEGASLQQIADELGFAAPIGAKAFVDRTLEKLRFLWELGADDPAALDRFVLLGTSEYIDYLESSGALTGEEIQLLKDNPTLVSSLSGFREFLHKFVKRGMREKKKQRGE